MSDFDQRVDEGVDATDEDQHVQGNDDDVLVLQDAPDPDSVLPVWEPTGNATVDATLEQLHSLADADVGEQAVQHQSRGPVGYGLVSEGGEANLAANLVGIRPVSFYLLGKNRSDFLPVAFDVAAQENTAQIEGVDHHGGILGQLPDEAVQDLGILLYTKGLLFRERELTLALGCAEGAAELSG